MIPVCQTDARPSSFYWRLDARETGAWSSEEAIWLCLHPLPNPREFDCASPSQGSPCQEAASAPRRLPFPLEPQVLLVFCLLIEKGDMPLIIDQPEGNLDNHTVVIPEFRSKDELLEEALAKFVADYRTEQAERLFPRSRISRA
jgi:hypothetical protein